MFRPKLAGAAVLIMLAASSASRADTTITVTATSANCQVPPPDEVAAPVTPSAAAGIAATKNRNFALARANFKTLAETGDAEAERLYGALLMQKCTGIQDQTAGATWLQKAADGGDAVAQGQLGEAYLNGDGVAQDDNKAFGLISKSAAAGQMPAQTDLGYMYLNGRGTSPDLYQGMVWSAKAGEQGAPMALSNIAGAYLRGKALPQDNDKAMFYINLAILRATPAQRARFQTNINNIGRAVSADDFKRAADKAKRWSPGKGALSDVTDDAAKMRDQMAKN